MRDITVGVPGTDLPVRITLVPEISGVLRVVSVSPRLQVECLVVTKCYWARGGQRTEDTLTRQPGKVLDVFGLRQYGRYWCVWQSGDREIWIDAPVLAAT